MEMGEKSKRAMGVCDQSDQSTNDTSDSDLVKKTKNYQTDPFQISDFILCINSLCRFTAMRTRKTNPFPHLVAPEPPRRWTCLAEALAKADPIKNRPQFFLYCVTCKPDIF